MGNKPPTTVVKNMHDVTSQIVEIHGGDWTYNDGTTPWKKEATEGYNSQTTCPEEDASRFEVSLVGPPVDSPEDAVAKVKTHFKDEDFTVTNRFSGTVKNGKVIVFSMGTDDGTAFVYQPGTRASGLLVKSECSTHSDMDQTTK
ncbi:hypothetical protein [Arthrobacter monumenti]